MSRSPSFSRQPKQFDLRRPQPVAEVLGRTDAFAALRAGVEQIAALEKDLRELLPDYLATSVEPGFIKEGVLALFAAHNALAARLRHLEPRLLSDLQQRGWPVHALKIRVRPQLAKAPPPVKQARMTPAGATALQQLSESLAPSPLQEALARMAARHRRTR
ncbi:DciA family protein [Paraburkholderia sp.]|uniref:DciA family protein n=1 Tax=Paraburkholderia sp. TaxID=1926495 RepID=UPI0039E5D3A7